MRATNTFQALCLGATLGLTGCVTVHDDSDRDYRPAPHAPAYGYHDEDYGVEHVYDSRLDVYTVVGFPEIWFSDGWYYRHRQGYWERCDRPRGGHWGRADWAYVPQRLRPRYGDYHGDGHDRWERRDEHRQDHHEHAEQRRDDRDQRTDWQHDRRDDRKVEHHERVDQHREARDERTDWRHDQRDERTLEHHERVDSRHVQRAERDDARHEERAERKVERHEQHAERHDKRDKPQREDSAGPVE